MKNLAILAVATILAMGLATGCQTESASTTGEAENGEAEKTNLVATSVAFNIERAPTAEIHVPDMMCQFACPPAVKKVLTAQAGVKEVKIDYETKTATVAIDETTFDGEAAVAALVDYQFGNSKLIITE